MSKNSLLYVLAGALMVVITAPSFSSALVIDGIDRWSEKGEAAADFFEQARDTLELMADRRVVIEVRDGRLLINGDAVEGDQPVVLEFEDGGHRERMLRLHPGRMHRSDEVDPHGPDWMRFRGPDGAAGGSRVMIRERDWPHIGGIGLDLPDIGPILDEFPFVRMRESFQEHREVAEMERDSREIAVRAREADGAERANLEAELRSKLQEIFDRKLELRRERIERLEEELTQAREGLERRRSAREEMIDRRMLHLLGEDDVLDW